MSKITHEILVVDRGLPSRRVVVRSSVHGPQQSAGMVGETHNQQSEVSVGAGKELDSLMDYHRASLVRVVGEHWIGEEI